MQTALVTELRRIRLIHIGDTVVGGAVPITVQSMTITKTADVEGTLQQICARIPLNDAPITQRTAERVRRSPLPPGRGRGTASQSGMNQHPCGILADAPVEDPSRVRTAGRCSGERRE
jgi:hypothetical protein